MPWVGVVTVAGLLATSKALLSGPNLPSRGAYLSPTHTTYFAINGLGLDSGREEGFRLSGEGWVKLEKRSLYDNFM